jgi:hypothetical protein
MNEIIQINDYEEILRQNVKKQYKLVFFIIMGITLLQSVVILIIYLTTDDKFGDKNIWFFLPVFILFSAFIINYFLNKHLNQKDTPHFSFEQYKNFESDGIKIPMYRMVQQGKYSQTYYVTADVKDDSIDFYDHYKKGMTLYKTIQKKDAKFRFYYKNKQGLEIIKSKIDLYAHDKKIRLYGIQELNEDILDALKEKGYTTENA